MKNPIIMAAVAFAILLFGILVGRFSKKNEADKLKEEVKDKAKDLKDKAEEVIDDAKDAAKDAAD